MNQWFFIATVENWNVIKKKKIVGVPKSRRNLFSKVKKGDKCLIYIKGEKKASKHREPSITGVFEVITSDYDDERIFEAPPTRPNETFPLRIKLRSITPVADPIPFKPLITQLSFIMDQKNWGRVLQGRVLMRISENDYQTVLSSLQKG